jgi:hypothetical protein
MYLILHSPHSKPSRDFVEQYGNDARISRVYNWNDETERREFLVLGYLSPSIFPAIIEVGNKLQIKNDCKVLDDDIVTLLAGKLEIERPIKAQQIKNRTKQIIEQGFKDSLSGSTLGCTDGDTANWSVLLQLKSSLSFPFSGVKDINGIPVTFNTLGNLEATFNAGVLYKMQVFGAESELLVAVKLASTWEELEAIQDTRG